MANKYGTFENDPREMEALRELAAQIGLMPEQIVEYVDRRAAAWTVERVDAARAADPTIDGHWIFRCPDSASRIVK